MDKENKDGALQAEDRGPGEAQRDEELFASLRRSKKERKKKRIRRAAIVVGVLAVVLVAAVLILRRQVRENFALDEEISQAEGDTVSSYISAGVAGRVKAIYASEGSGVAEVMVDSQSHSHPAKAHLGRRAHRGSGLPHRPGDNRHLP